MIQIHSIDSFLDSLQHSAAGILPEISFARKILDSFIHFLENNYSKIFIDSSIVVDLYGLQQKITEFEEKVDVFY